MSSSSKSNQASTSINKDNRIVASDKAVAVNSEGGAVSVHVVADEAFELAEMTVNRFAETVDNTTEVFSQALFDTQKNSRTESAQLSEQIIKIGIPALALVFLVGKMKG